MGKSAITRTGYAFLLTISFVAVALCFASATRAQESGKAEAGSGIDDLWDVPAAKKGKGAPAAKGSSKERKLLGPSVRRESFLRYNVVGGEEAFDRSLVIRGDGTMKLRDEDGATKEGRLNSSALRQLIKQFQLFERLDPVYGEKNSDPFQKTTTLVRHVAKGSPNGKDGRPRASLSDSDTIIVYHSSETILPTEVTKLITGLNRLIDDRLAERTEMKVEFRGIAAAGMLDRYRYPLVIGDPPIASELWLHLSVANLTDEPFAVSFETDQSYEITIISSDGKERWRWSRGKTFPARPRKVRLVRDWLSYVERIDLRDPSGLPFLPGKYSLRYEILSDPPFRGETEFLIEAEGPKARKEDFKAMLSKHRDVLERAGSTGSGKAAKAGKGAKGQKAKAGKGAGKGAKRKKKG